MKLRFAIAAAMALAVAAQERPTFRAENIVPFGGQPGGPYAPGVIVTIYGQHLARGGETAGQTVVMAGEEAAQLLFASTNQVNLRLPDKLPRDGLVPLRVIREGVSSLPVFIRLSSKPVIALAQTAYTGLPVWLAVELPYPLTGSLAYPVSFDPSDFGDNVVELRRDGVPLEEMPLGLPPGIVRAKPEGIQRSLAVAADASLRNRLPLHLKFRFEEPGVYEVRYSLMRGKDAEGESMLRSEWTEITVLPSSPELRAAWLTEMRQQDPASAGELLCSFLPSLLAQRTPETFAILSRYFSHRNGLVQLYTHNVARVFAGIVPQSDMPALPDKIVF